MITTKSLNAQTSKDLAQLAKKKGISGWHSMRKEQLINAILKLAKAKDAEKKVGKTATSKSTAQTAKLSGSRMNASRSSGSRKSEGAAKDVTRLVAAAGKGITAMAKNSDGKMVKQDGKSGSRNRRHETETQVNDSPVARQIRVEREADENRKNLALITSLDANQRPPEADRLILVVRDSFWVQAYWEITKATVQRAKVALNGIWHQARPVLRLLEVTSDGNTNSVENQVEEIEIHGGVKNWYFKIHQPAKTYRMAIGYAVPDGRFHLICKSNQIMTPNSSAGALDENWTDITNDAEKFYALSGGYDPAMVSCDLQSIFEEKSRHPMNAPAFERLGSGINGHHHEFEFQVEAHMIIYGATNPNASVSIGGEPVRLQRDGTFSLKVDLPDKRQVLPIVASSRDGTQQRTTVLAIERNTKVMEPFSSDMDNS